MIQPPPIVIDTSAAPPRSQPKPKPRFRFRLRTALIVFFLAAAGLGFWRQTIGYYRNQIDTAMSRHIRLRASADHVQRFSGPYEVSFLTQSYDAPQWHKSMPQWVRRFVPTVDNEWFVRNFHLVVGEQRTNGQFTSPPPTPAQIGPFWDAVTQFKELEAIAIDSPNFDDDDLPRLRDMPNLKLLNLPTTSLTEAGLEHFKTGFPSLKYLVVGSGIRRPARERLLAARPELEIQAQPGLGSLVDYVLKVELKPGNDPDFARRDEEFTSLVRANAYMKRHHEADLFRLAGAGRVKCDQGLLLDDESFARLRRSRHLETLVLNWTLLGPSDRKISSELLDRVNQLPTLRYLGLCGRMESESVVERLRELPLLEVLWLYDTTLTADHIAAVTKLPHLKRLLVTVPTSQADVAGFEAKVRAALPQVETSFDYQYPNFDAWTRWRGPEWTNELGGRSYFPMFRRMIEFHPSPVLGPWELDSFIAMGRQKTLRAISLGVKQLSADSLRQLVDLPELEELQLSVARSSEPEGDPIAEIAAIKSLKKVYLVGATGHHLAKLKSLRPDLETFNTPAKGRTWVTEPD